MPIDIQTGLATALGRLKKTSPCQVNRISALDDPCLRRLYYMRAAWDKAAPVSDGLQGAFETGTLLEPIIEGIAREVGAVSVPQWRIVGSQMPTNDALLKKYQISGTIDGLLQTKDNGSWSTAGVVDIKTCSANIYPAMTDYASLARYPWTAKYRGQLQLYSFAHNLEKCFILFVSKGNLYEMKFVEFDVDMDYCEKLLQKAQAVNTAIDMGVPPAGVNDAEVCPDCPWYSFCAPDLTLGAETIISDSKELQAVLDRLEEMRGVGKEISTLESRRDELLVKGQNTICGGWLVTWKRSVIHRKATEASETEQWRKTIIRTPGKP